MFTRSMTLLNTTGDTTLAWTEDADEKMLKMIQDKLDQGYIFFHVHHSDPDWIKRVKVASDIKDRSVLMLDDDMLELFEGNNIGVATNEKKSNIVSASITRVADIIKKSNTVAVKPICGG